MTTRRISVIAAAGMIGLSVAAATARRSIDEPVLEREQKDKPPNDPRVSRQVRRAQNRAATKNLKGNR